MAKQKPISEADAELAELGYGNSTWSTSVEKRDASERQLGLTFALIYSKFGLTKREIIRCLKRYLAREVYFLLNPGQPAPERPHTRKRLVAA